MPLTVLGLQSRWAGGLCPLCPSQHIRPLVPHTAPRFRAGFEGSRVVEVLQGEGARDGLGMPLCPPPQQHHAQALSWSPRWQRRGLWEQIWEVAPTFSKRETLLAFRAAASSTKGGPRPKISRSSSLFCGSRGLSTATSTSPALPGSSAQPLPGGGGGCRSPAPP